AGRRGRRPAGWTGGGPSPAAGRRYGGRRRRRGTRSSVSGRRWRRNVAQGLLGSARRTAAADNTTGRPRRRGTNGHRLPRGTVGASGSTVRGLPTRGRRAVVAGAADRPHGVRARRAGSP